MSESRSRILCVDDDGPWLSSLATALGELGFSVSEARSGERALDVLLREGADLVVLDLGLPGMDGVVTCRELKSLAGESFLPILFLTANVDLATRIRVLEAGGDDFCSKPCFVEELACRIRVLLRARDRERRLEHESGKFRRIALLDPLTELGNRRAFDGELAREWARHERHGRPLSLLLADVDHFKGVNDRHGHAAGDLLLRGVARSIERAVRQGDTAYRQGGDEFAVVLPETDAQGALAVADRVRRDIAGDIGAGRSPISLSIGVAAVPDPSVRGAADLVASADRALYAAKRGGRGQVAISTQAVGPDYSIR